MCTWPMPHCWMDATPLPATSLSTLSIYYCDCAPPPPPWIDTISWLHVVPTVWVAFSRGQSSRMQVAVLCVLCPAAHSTAQPPVIGRQATTPSSGRIAGRARCGGTRVCWQARPRQTAAKGEQSSLRCCLPPPNPPGPGTSYRSAGTHDAWPHRRRSAHVRLAASWLARRHTSLTAVHAASSQVHVAQNPTPQPLPHVPTTLMWTSSVWHHHPGVGVHRLRGGHRSPPRFAQPLTDGTNTPRRTG